MAESVVRIQTSRDAAGNLTEVYCVKEASSLPFPKHFMKKYFEVQGPVSARQLDVLAALVLNTQNNCTQIGTMKGQNPQAGQKVLSLEHDTLSAASTDLRAYLVEPKLAYLLAVCIEAGAVLEASFLPLRGFELDMIKIYAKDLAHADVRVEHPLANRDYFASFAPRILAKLCAVTDAGYSLARLLEPQWRSSFLRTGSAPAALVETQKLIEEQTRASLRRLFHILLCYLARKPESYLTRADPLFPRKLEECIDALPYSREMRALFMTILSQGDMLGLTTYTRFKALVLDCREKPAGDFEQRLCHYGSVFRGQKTSGWGLKIRAARNAMAGAPFEIDPANPLVSGSEINCGPKRNHDQNSAITRNVSPVISRPSERQRTPTEPIFTPSMVPTPLADSVIERGRDSMVMQGDMFGLKVRKVSLSPVRSSPARFADDDQAAPRSVSPIQVFSTQKEVPSRAQTRTSPYEEDMALSSNRIGFGARNNGSAPPAQSSRRNVYLQEPQMPLAPPLANGYSAPMQSPTPRFSNAPPHESFSQAYTHYPSEQRLQNVSSQARITLSSRLTESPISHGRDVGNARPGRASSIKKPGEPRGNKSVTFMY